MFVSRALLPLPARRALARFAIHNVRRLAISSTTRSFATSTDSTSKIDVLAQTLGNFDHVSTIHTTYHQFVEELRKAKMIKPTPSPLQQNQLIGILQSLAKSGRPEDLQRIEEILHDLQPMLGIEPTMDYYSAIIRGLIDRGNVATVHNWLLKMPKLPGFFAPTLEHFHTFLEACTEISTFKVMRAIVFDMRRCRCKPTNQTFHILIRGRWKLALEEGNIPHVVVFSSLMEDMEKFGLPFDPSTERLLYDGYAEVGRYTDAEKVRVLYKNKFKVAKGSGEWQKSLSRAAKSDGVAAALALFKVLEVEGCPRSPVVISSIVRHSRTVADLQLVENQLQVQCNEVHWAMVISNCLRSGQITQGLEIYQASVQADVKPDAALVSPILRALRRLEPPEDSAIDQALAIYHDLAKAHPPTIVGEEADQTPRTHPRGPDLNIYHTLFQMLASSEDLDKYHPIAFSLLEDMKARDISTNDSSITASIIILQMRRASDMAEAMEIYHQHRSSLDGEGYAVVLGCVSKLQFGNLPLPSIRDYFSIVNDMRMAGIELNAKVYTILLHRVAKLATHLKKTDALTDELRNFLVTTTRRIHDFISLDASLTPDAILWNQVMDTYQRLGCFADAYRVWEVVYLTGRFDYVSISIILDACTHAGELSTATAIWNKLSRDRYAFNLHNWNTWTECLCRLGRLGDAVGVVCTGMQKGGIEPDVETVKILVKYARQLNQHYEVLSHVEHYLPHLYSELPEYLKVKKSV